MCKYIPVEEDPLIHTSPFECGSFVSEDHKNKEGAAFQMPASNSSLVPHHSIYKRKYKYQKPVFLQNQ